MRKFVKKWKGLIVWGIAIFFTFGIVWWSIAMYMSYRRPSVKSNEYKPNPEDAVAILTKEGTPLNWQYWVMPYELEDRVRAMTQIYYQYGLSYDDLFTGPIMRLTAARDLLDDKVTLYYADTHGLRPKEEEVNQQIDKIVEKYTKDEKTKNYIIQRYGSIDAFKKKIAQGVLVELVKNKVKTAVAKVSEDDVKRYFEEHKDEIKENYDKVKVKHILLDSKEKAEEVLTKIKSGEIDFTKAASEYSLDEDTKKEGGELGWLTKISLDPNFAEAAFSATLNEPVGPVESAYGWHIIDVEDRKIIDTFDDLKEATQAYKDVENKIAREKFKEWLDGYKKKEDISYLFEDESLRLYDEYYTIVSSTPSTYTDEKLDAFLKKLESRITSESTTSTTVINTDVDPTILTLYVNVMEKKLNEVSEKASKYRRYYTLSNSVPKNLLEMDDKEIEAKIEELDEKLGNATGTEYQRLFQEKMSYRDAQTLKRMSEEMEKENVTPEDAKKLAEKYDKLSEDYKEKIKRVLRALYEIAPYSKTVVSKLHNYDPTDLSVSLRFYQMKYEDMKPYISDPEIMETYKNQLLPQIFSVKLGLEMLTFDEKASTDLKVQALETLVSLSRDMRDYQEELRYLKKLKEISPNYPDIDELIKDAESMIETTKATSSSTPTTLQSTETTSTTESEK
ncbi:MAG TPA: hypothetical protein ENG58_01680 [Thermotogales bacterium]|nr:hypothetical protein [Thermotogales bacterium]